MEPSIETCRLTKRFPLVKRYRDIILRPLARREVTALRDVSLAARPGELLGILGPNGAGKSTLLRILATLVLPDGGWARVNGFDTAGQPALVRRAIGFAVNEERSFYWRLTGWQNLSFFATLNNIPPRALPARLEQVLDLVGLGEQAHRMFKDYSAGMKQRLIIARSLLTEPAVLLLDEPTRSLDPAAAGKLKRFIRRELVERRGKTVCLSTHNLAEAEALCDRVAILDRGRLLACDRPGRIRARRSAGRVLAVVLAGAFTEPAPALRALCRARGWRLLSLAPGDPGTRLDIELENPPADIAGIVAAFSGAGMAVSACFPRAATLEEAFGEIIAGQGAPGGR